MIKFFMATVVFAMLFAPSYGRVFADTIPPVTASTDKNTVEVEAEGTGATKMEALKSAWMEAVRKGIGMFMTSKTEIINDDITENIVTHSQGHVNSYKTLSEDKSDGIWTIVILANIDKDILEETAKSVQSKEISIDASATAAKNISDKEKKKSAKEVLQTAKDFLDFTDCLDYNAELKEVDANGTKLYFLKHILKVNLKKYKIQSDKLEKIISSISSSKYSMPLIVDFAKYGMQLLKEKDIKIPIKYCNELYSPLRNNMRLVFNTGEELRKNTNLCFVKNTAEAECYYTGIEDFRTIIEPIAYKFTFIAEDADAGFDSVIARNEDRIHYPNPYYLISPSFNGSTVLIFLQKLNLTNEQMLQLKKIKGRYTVQKLN